LQEDIFPSRLMLASRRLLSFACTKIGAKKQSRFCRGAFPWLSLLFANSASGCWTENWRRCWTCWTKSWGAYRHSTMWTESNKRNIFNL